MASYSTNLALTLLDTGAGAGTWGNTTNTNLGTLLEQAISGYDTQSLTSGVTLTLTIPNGSTGVARNMYLEFTGNGSTVIVPSNKKLYFVYNNCSSGTITMKVAGQTGVTVEKGAKQILVSNGTDIQEAISGGIDGETTVSITAVGVNAGTALTSGSGVITMGYNAGAAITSGTYLTAIGHNAGAALTNNLYTTIVGAEAGSQYAKSSNNYFGYAAGRNMDSAGNCGFGFLAVRGDGAGASGTGNCGFGNETLAALTSGSVNTAIGSYAGDAITTGTWNTVVGAYAGGNITSGGANTFVGFNAGVGVTTSSTNTALGDTAYQTGNYSNSICLGYSSSVSGSDQGKIGNGNVDVYAKSFNNTSDVRDKADIQNTNLGLSFIMQLQPRMFRWDMREFYQTKPPVEPKRSDYETDEAYQAALNQWRLDWDSWEEANKLANITHDGSKKRNRFHQGLIAQEVKQTIDAMGVDFGGFRDSTVNGGDAQMGLEYTQFIAPLIKAIQELKAEFDEYKRTHP